MHGRMNTLYKNCARIASSIVQMLMRLFFAPPGPGSGPSGFAPRARLLHFGLRLPRALALLRFLDLLAGHLCSDIGHCTGDVASRSARRQSKECKLHPLQGFDAILRDTVACRVEKSQVKLRKYHALVGRTPKPLGRVDVALLNPRAAGIAGADVVLRGSVALICGALEPHEGHRVVMFDTGAFPVQGTETVLGGSVPCFRERAPQLGRLGVRFRVISSDAVLERPGLGGCAKNSRDSECT